MPSAWQTPKNTEQEEGWTDGLTDGRTRLSAISQSVCCCGVALCSAMEGYRHLGVDQYSDISGQCWFTAEQHKRQPCPAWLDTETLIWFHSCLCLSWTFFHLIFFELLENEFALCFMASSYVIGGHSWIIWEVFTLIFPLGEQSKCIF